MSERHGLRDDVSERRWLHDDDVPGRHWLPDDVSQLTGSKNDDDVSERHWLQEHWSRQKRKVHLQTRRVHLQTSLALTLDPSPSPKP